MEGREWRVGRGWWRALRRVPEGFKQMKFETCRDCDAARGGKYTKVVRSLRESERPTCSNATKLQISRVCQNQSTREQKRSVEVSVWSGLHLVPI